MVDFKGLASLLLPKLADLSDFARNPILMKVQLETNFSQRLLFLVGLSLANQTIPHEVYRFQNSEEAQRGKQYAHRVTLQLRGFIQ